MADKKNDLAVKLLAGQQKLERDVVDFKTDVTELKTDVSVLKTDVAELKEGQNRVEKFLLNLENIIVPKINTMYEISISNTEQIKRVDETDLSASFSL